jgi:predicted metalloprotease with PDZ domain
MIQYSIILNQPEKHYIDISVKIDTRGADKLNIQLPAWRPGRYELANFAQNIRKWEVIDENGRKLGSHKIKKDCWVIETGGCAVVSVNYDYFSNLLDAGNTYFNENQLYINPVNCLIYILERINEPCEIQLTNLPENYKLAGSLVFDSGRKAIAKDYHTLVDSPFIAHSDFKIHEFVVDDHNFTISIIGNVHPDWERILPDFKAFCAKQIGLYGELPVKDYHFLYQMPDYKYYHGVEHLASNVVCIGPAESLRNEEFYHDFLGISSHELFHSWNVKSIRPVEMYPYDYSKENYTALNYVTEGVTSYYGDYMLLKSGVYSSEIYFIKTARTIERHEHNFGKLYQTLSEASMDSWLDGYKIGAPERKISFYQKGMIVAWILDLNVRRDTNNIQSLDSVMKILYHEFARKSKGYSEADYLNIISSIAGKDYRSFFERFIWGLEDVVPVLNEALSFIGCELTTRPSALHFEDWFGFRLLEADPVNSNIITHIAPESPAERVGLSLGDKIIAINGIAIEMNLNEVLSEHKTDSIEISFMRRNELLTVSLTKTDKRYYPVYQIIKKAEADSLQKQNYKLWANQEFLP